MSRAGGFSACLNCFRVTVHSVLSNTLRDAQIYADRINPRPRRGLTCFS